MLGGVSEVSLLGHVDGTSQDIEGHRHRTQANTRIFVTKTGRNNLNTLQLIMAYVLNKFKKKTFTLHLRTINKPGP